MSFKFSTPFGGRPLSLAQATAQVTATVAPPSITMNKWTVLEDITGAKKSSRSARSGSLGSSRVAELPS
ncbi:MAG: hypothetical protein KME20_27000 [Kaiparowitsia implicata GSE-PSE-MK54-09C]|nr:hypothetical protein [Kaiparowitsia implicata GSE-PSE-MK54-09C]